MNFRSRALACAARCALLTALALGVGCQPEAELPQYSFDTSKPDKDTSKPTPDADTPDVQDSKPADPTLPTVAFKVPVDGSCVGGELVVEVEADHDTGISSVDLVVDEEVVGTATKAVKGVYKLQFDASTHGDGPITMKAVATAGSGKSASADVALTVDNTPPILTLDRPLGNEVILGELYVSGEAKDTKGCGIGEIRIALVGGESDVDESIAVSGAPETTSFKRTVETGDLPSFDGTAEITAVDLAGNEAMESRTVYVVRPLDFLQAKSVVPQDVGSIARIAGGDWDADGVTDVLIGAKTGIWFMRSRGDSSFDVPVLLSEGNVESLQALDVDLDGDLDVVAAMPGKPNNVGVFVRGEDGPLVLEQSLEVPDSLAINDLVLADLTGDGAFDVVVTTDSDKKSVVVFVGNDESGYSGKPDGEREYFATSYKSFGGVASVRDTKAGDFDNDGNLDLALGSYGDSKVSVFRGDGKGGFLAAYDTNLPEDIAAIAPGYFAGDDSLDLVVASQKSGKQYILIGVGDGNFVVQPPLAVIGGGPTSLASGDFNNDLKTDFVVARTASKNIGVFFGGDLNGQGQSYVAGNSPTSILLGQFTAGDSAMDIVVLNQSDQRISLIRGNEDGTFAAAPLLEYPLACDSNGKCTAMKPTALVVEDFDGLPGLEAAFILELEKMYYAIWFYPSNGVRPAPPLDGVIVPSVYEIPPLDPEGDIKEAPKGKLVDMVSGDFDGDGRADLAVALGTVVNSGVTPDTVVPNVDILLHADAPGTSFEDAMGLWAGPEFSFASIDGGDLKPVKVELELANKVKIVDIDVADMTGDTLPDLLVLTSYLAKFNTGEGLVNVPSGVTAFRSKGDGNFDRLSQAAVDLAAQSDPGAIKLMVGDVNVDDHNDAVVLNNKISDVAVLYGEGGVLDDGQLVSVVSTNPMTAALRQMNADEDDYPDVLSVGKDMRVSYGRAHTIGEQPFETPLSHSNYPGGKASSIDAADFNGDGLMDVIITDSGGHVVFLYVNIGDRQFAKDPVVIHTAPGPKSVEAKDLDQDGCVDMVVLCTGGLTVLRNQICDP